MACTVSASIAEALRKCGSCDPRPISRDWKRVDLVEADRVGLGSDVFVRLDSIPIRDALGRYAHVRGFYFMAQAVLAVEANAAAVPAYALRSWMQALYMSDHTGHQYWATLDGRSLLDDVWCRHWRQLQQPYLHYGVQGTEYPDITDDNGYPGQLAGEPANVAVDASIYAPLTTAGRSPLEGLIPLASLQMAGADGLKFRIAQSLRGTFSGVTLEAIRDPLSDTEGMQVWADIVYLPAVVIDAPYKLRNYVRPELSGELNEPDAIHEYAWVRYFPEDTFQATPPVPDNGQTIVNQYEGISLSVGDNDVMSGYVLSRAILRQRLWYGTANESAQQRNNAALDLPLTIANQGTNYQTALMLLGYQGREPGAGAGAAHFEFQTRGAATSTRYLHRTVGCYRTPEVAQEIAQAALCKPCGVLGVNGKGTQVPGIMQGQPMVVLSDGTTTSRLARRR